MADDSFKSIFTKPYGKKLKEQLDSWLGENIVENLGKQGYPDTGAAIGAILSAGGELAIPDNVAEAAMMAVPGAGLMGKAAKGAKGLKKAGEAAKDVAKVAKKERPVLDYSKINDIKKVQKKNQDKASEFKWKDREGDVEEGVGNFRRAKKDKVEY